jgi:hypothetical protein
MRVKKRTRGERNDRRRKRIRKPKRQRTTHR